MRSLHISIVWINKYFRNKMQFSLPSTKTNIVNSASEQARKKVSEAKKVHKSFYVSLIYRKIQDERLRYVTSRALFSYKFSY
jgi:hypothetical protein